MSKNRILTPRFHFVSREFVVEILIGVILISFTANELNSKIHLPAYANGAIIIAGLVVIIAMLLSAHKVAVLDEQTFQKLRSSALARIKDEVEQYRQNQPYISLDFKRDPIDNLAPAWSAGEKNYPSGASILQIFNDAGGRLVILGAPGAGKSYMLRRLALELLQTDREVIPVVFSLASWPSIQRKNLVRMPYLSRFETFLASWPNTQQQDLGEWMMEYLPQYLGVAKHIAQELLDQRRILPLFDAFDEVKDALRTDCIEAINTYLGDNMTPQFALTSRVAEYEAMSQKHRLALQFPPARIQPLSEAQIQDFLDNITGDVSALRSAIAQDNVLRELTHTPLFLGVAATALSNEPSAVIPAGLDEQGMRDFLYARYAPRALDRQDAKVKADGQHKKRSEQPQAALSRAQITHTLQWLAWGMERRDESRDVFYIEQLQADWAPVKAPMTRRYLWLVYTLFSALVIEPFFWLVFWLAYVLFGASVGAPISGLIFGLLFVPFGVLSSTIYNSVTKIAPPERLSVSFGRLFLWLINGQIVGLFVGLIVEPFLGSVYGQIVWLFVGLVLGMFRGLTVGLTPSRLQDDVGVVPNQGIINAAHNAWLIVRIGFGVSILTCIGLIFWRSVSPIWQNHTNMIEGIIILSLLPLAIAILFAYFRGFKTVLLHAVLRRSLARVGAIPRDFTGFLEYAAGAVILYRSGGGFRFLHGTLREYLARQFKPGERFKPVKK